MLKRESPTDEEVGRALFEAQVQLKKQRGEDTQDLKFGSNLVFVSSNERFRHFVTSPGKSKTKAFAAMDLECVFVRIGHVFFFFFFDEDNKPLCMNWQGCLWCSFVANIMVKQCCS